MNPLALQSIALEVAAARSVPVVLRGIVEGLVRDPGVALARIWLRRPGDQCEVCAFRDACPRHVECLHLVASAGESILDSKEGWDRLDGRFRRFPLGTRKVGKIGETGEALLLPIEASGSPWLADPEWARLERLHCFAGQPLVFREEVLGVVAFFSRVEITAESFGWLRTFADQAAVAIANARAFEEVDRLREQLELERDYLREEFKVATSFSGMIGESPALLQIGHQIGLVAPTEASVLILGESGTGKELIASAIHERSDRAEKPMVRVNCASIPRELFESEFFGHARGAFTGAVGERAGRFQIADGGTLFLDEVGEIPLELQGKLLRVLQEGQFSRVGEDSVRTTHVRLITATNRNLKGEVAAGRFREDLYYRLSVFPIEVPPLRDRREDIPLLASHFLRHASSLRNSEGLLLRRRDVDALLAYDWPGNVRELQNVIERAVILSSAGRLHIDLAQSRTLATNGRRGSEKKGERVLTDLEMRESDRENLLRAMESAGGKISGPGGAAELLGIRPTTLNSRLKKFGIQIHRGHSG